MTVLTSTQMESGKRSGEPGRSARTPSDEQKSRSGSGTGRAIVDSAGGMSFYRRWSALANGGPVSSVLWLAASIHLLGIAKKLSQRG